MQSTIVNYICQCGCGCKFVKEADLGSDTSAGDENNAFHDDWA